ncbi:hypothetical protein F5884DRAFT_903499 [Xylogone sp. PMI_703]|nr:hypothetical protein F5884DRAFT_903499 [Xylogone sp. PMI_703]
MSSTSASASPTSSTGAGSAQASEGISLVALLTALASSLVIFGIQMFAFLLLRNKLARIFKPKTYLVPEKERTEPPPSTPWGWLFAIFRFTDREVIKKCGLDAYFFLRYLQTLLVIFVPLAVVILPILLPLNYIGGRGGNWYAEATGNSTTAKVTSANQNVTGLDTLAWGNVRPSKTNRYWAHLILAVFVIIWVCGVFFAELKVYIKVRQDYLTSAEHRLRASATTVLVSAIPEKWLTTEALGGLYDVFPGGIRNIWINRNYDELLKKIHERDAIFKKLEAAETELIRKAKKAQKKKQAKAEKTASKGARIRGPTKEEKQQQLEQENARAAAMATTGGTSNGDASHIPHTIDDAIDEEEQRERNEQTHEQTHKHTDSRTNNIFKKLNPLNAVEQGIGAIGEVAGRTGDAVLGGARHVGRDFNNQLETTNGFVNLDRQSVQDVDDYKVYKSNYEREKMSSPPLEQYGEGRPSFATSYNRESPEPKWTGNKVRPTTSGHDALAVTDTGNSWWKFWVPPSGGFASPIPHGWEEGDEYPLTKKASQQDPRLQNKSIWTKIKSIIPFLRTDEMAPAEYPLAYNPDYKEDATGAVWEKYLSKKDRPTHRLARFSWTPDWLPGLPLINKKVDTIYWCRGELARLNLEIEMDQQHPEKFPLMNSAFIQFNNQVAAHMAAQSITYHLPRQMAPRTVEISPDDVIWDNMSIKWWEAWMRTGIIIVLVAGMVILWAFPVAWTASLSQITTLAQKYSWLHWLRSIPQNVLKAVAGVLPAIVLSILLILVPKILEYLSFLQGAQTGTEKQGYVQTYYFAFLFVQVFLVVSISGGALATLGATAAEVTSIPQTLATQLPKAANYFFSYMILQALSTSSGTLLQIVTLLLWFVLPKFFDNTAREKWHRNTNLPNVTWGSFFPVYTNFACIALVYSIVSPLIIIFAIITFTLLWIANRYNMLYVSRFKLDTGGLLYPRAINQTFTGLYVMELCLIGLFFLVRDEQGNASCIPQAIIMIVCGAFTILYQYLLNYAFSPLFYYLPITFEDEAVLRDEAFERAQARRLGLDQDPDEAARLSENHDGSIELSNLRNGTSSGNDGKLSKLNPVSMVKGAGTFAAKSGRILREKTMGRGTDHDIAREDHAVKMDPTTAVRRKRRHRDIEAQQKISNALYGGYADEIEDLTPEERDVLVRHAFQHYALRARRPMVWIPRDDIGVSDDEIRRTKEFGGGNIWITNVGAALDGKCRVVYGRNPPDFSEVDLINL